MITVILNGCMITVILNSNRPHNSDFVETSSFATPPFGTSCRCQFSLGCSGIIALSVGTQMNAGSITQDTRQYHDTRQVTTQDKPKHKKNQGEVGQAERKTRKGYKLRPGETRQRGLDSTTHMILEKEF
jgi:hypothetical protein